MSKKKLIDNFCNQEVKNFLNNYFIEGIVMGRRIFMAAVLALYGGGAFAQVPLNAGEVYPARPIRLVNSLSAGSAGDRLLGHVQGAAGQGQHGAVLHQSAGTGNDHRAHRIRAHNVRIVVNLHAARCVRQRKGFCERGKKIFLRCRF